MASYILTRADSMGTCAFGAGGKNIRTEQNRYGDTPQQRVIYLLPKAKTMYKPSIGITKEGWPIIGLCTLSTLTFAILEWDILALALLGLTFFSCHFFRDPERVVPDKPGCAVSPADGKIIKITNKANPFTLEPCQCISIFMNVFSVHVNRSPVAGTVTDITYYPGSFVNAALDKAAIDNERCAYALKDADGNDWSMIQISGLIARRIVCGVEKQTPLARGERFGMIRFGSRVDLYLPQGYTPAVAIGDQVFAGQTIVAEKTLASS